ncbi:uncharacterized protein LOC129262462 [Lytechinus pictus]|uniref:uncharacterized protein LOC129262462 n=1 Tax=Lytechinus pictus TaxID=7653 RepID=UPI0030B9E032
MNDLQNYGSGLGPGAGDTNYSYRLGDLRSGQSILPSKPYPGTLPMRAYQDSRDTTSSVDSLLAGPFSHPSYNDITDDDSLNDMPVTQSTRAHLLPNPVEQLSLKTRGVQLPVKHTNEIGTQIGILLPKYHVHPQSKCIMCRDCGIFFSHGSFLRHLHDNIGRRTDCQSSMLELGVDNPGVQQMKLWDDFLAKLKGEEGSHARPRTSSYDLNGVTSNVALEGNHYRSSSDSFSSTQPIQPRRPAMHYSPRTSMRGVQRSLPTTKGSQLVGPSGNSPPNSSSEASSISDLNKNIQNTVDASERLLRETSQYLASTEKSRHRRNRSITMDLHSKSEHPEGKSQASRSLFGSQSSHVAPHQQNRPREHSSKAILSPSGTQNENGNTDGIQTARFPQDSRIFAGGDLPSNTSNPDTRSTSQGNPSSVNAMRVASSVLPQGEAGSRFRFPVLNGDLLEEQNQQNSTKDKQDPLFILQTAQELLTLASHRIQILKDVAAGGNGVPKSPGRDDEFLKLYHEERSKRRKFEAQIQQLQESLQEEQKQRKELEIQLRALKLQR